MARELHQRAPCGHVSGARRLGAESVCDRYSMRLCVRVRAPPPPVYSRDFEKRVRNRVLCYSGRSMDKGCEYAEDPHACVPGCTQQTVPCSLADVHSNNNCAWGASQLEQLMKQADSFHNYLGYNEVT